MNVCVCPTLCVCRDTYCSRSFVHLGVWFHHTCYVYYYLYVYKRVRNYSHPAKPVTGGALRLEVSTPCFCYASIFFVQNKKMCMCVLP